MASTKHAPTTVDHLTQALESAREANIALHEIDLRTLQPSVRVPIKDARALSADLVESANAAIQAHAEAQRNAS